MLVCIRPTEDKGRRRFAAARTGRTLVDTALASVRHIPAPNDLLIICHHGVSATWPSEFAIPPEALEKQLRFLLGRGYRPQTLESALAGPGGKALVVTFDDAYRSVLREGFPLLSRLGVPATVFAPTAYVASGEPMAWQGMEEWVGGPHEEELAPMSWEELRRLRDEGWEIGSHSRTHPDLARLDPAALAAELRGSREECEAELQRPCASLAYPFSSYDERVKRAARDAGYGSALILDNRVAIPPRSVPGEDADRFELLRAGIYRGDGMPRFIAKTSPLVRRLRAGKPLRMAMRFGPRRVSA